MADLQKWIVAAFAAVVLLGPPTPAWACGCSPVPGYDVTNTVRDALGWADHVFIGRVVRRGRGMVTLAVEEWWKGGESPELYIVSAVASDLTTEVVSDCDFSFADGRQYVVFAQRSKLGLTVSSCSPSAEVSRSASIVAELDRLAMRPRRARPQPAWLPSNTRVEPAATSIVVAFQHPAAAAHARGR